MSLPDIESTQMEVNPLSTIYPLISNSFSGNPYELPEFIANCDNAFEFVAESQKKILLAFVISKITGSAKALMSDKHISDWTDLKQLLLRLYSDRKNNSQLMEELNNVQQKSNETILDYYNRIDKIQTRLLNNLRFLTPNQQNGRSELIKELVLQRFVLHSNPDIARFLRGQHAKDLPQALKLAQEEERALQIYKPSRNTNQGVVNNKFCQFCKIPGHLIKDCYKKRNSNRNVHFNTPVTSTRKPTTSSNPPTNQAVQNNSTGDPRQKKICKYCKKLGHLINECYTLKRNNERQKNSETNPNNRIHLNYQDPEKNVVSGDHE